ncbi:RidA family protein [uncultured Campylobacter sp.]|uniref:RidA family protein n=1 Tax=uncultured Campylobacter sp. TaxID=218934 RepID=UPI002612F961|nr:RidA family protein [uncultured Campylobacter sp.]
MKIISTKNAPAALGPYSQGVLSNGFLFTSGQIAMNVNGEFLDGGIALETNQVLINLKAILKEADLTLSDVVKANIFLVNMDNFDVVNRIYEKFMGEHKPARSTVGVASLPKNANIEIEFIAKKR